MISLVPYTTFAVQAMAQRILHITDPKQIPFGSKSDALILGGGSNILFLKDYPGIILKNEIKGRQIIHETAEEVIIKFGAGEIWHEVVLWTLAQSYGGLQNLSLIPGTIGAAPIQNIGAYGVEFKEVFYSLEAYSMDSGRYLLMTSEDCRFGYRDSIFKHALKNKVFISSVSLRLTKTKHRIDTAYGAIETALRTRGIVQPTIHDISSVVSSIRKSKLPDPEHLPNAGSFFKNPVVSLAIANEISKQYPELKVYPIADPNKVKLSAAWLIDQCNWKGQRRGTVGVYAKHALILVNYGQATGADVWDLAGAIIRSVQQKFGIELEAEVTLI